jgi:hypothetical protein
MNPLLWLLVPIGATLIAIVVVAWVSRPKPPADVYDAMASRERFRAAMERRPGAQPDEER